MLGRGPGILRWPTETGLIYRRKISASTAPCPSEGFAALRIVLVTVPRFGGSCKHILDGFDLNLLLGAGIHPGVRQGPPLSEQGGISKGLRSGGNIFKGLRRGDKGLSPGSQDRACAEFVHHWTHQPSVEVWSVGGLCMEGMTLNMKSLTTVNALIRS